MYPQPPRGPSRSRSRHPPPPRGLGRPGSEQPRPARWPGRNGRPPTSEYLTPVRELGRTRAAPDDYERWSQAILDAARATPHKFGRHGAVIAGVLEELFRHYQPDDPDAFCALVRALLLERNRLELMRLSRADLD